MVSPTFQLLGEGEEGGHLVEIVGVRTDFGKLLASSAACIKQKGVIAPLN